MAADGWPVDVVERRAVAAALVPRARVAVAAAPRAVAAVQAGAARADEAAVAVVPAVRDVRVSECISLHEWRDAANGRWIVSVN